MTVTAHKTQGTELFYVSGASASTKIGQVSGMSGLSGPRDQLDKTALDSTEREYESGFANPGQVTVNVVFSATDTSQAALIALKDSGVSKSWMIALSDATTTPTVTSSAFATFTSRSNITFTAYVADVALDFPLNDIVKGTVTLQRSGAWTLVPKST